MLELEEITVANIGEESADPARMWATVTIRLREPASDHFFAVSVECLVPKGPDVTLREVDAEAKSQTETILSAALHALQTHPAAA